MAFVLQKGGRWLEWKPLSTIVSEMYLVKGLGYITYFVTGYFLQYHIKLSQKNRRLLYVLGLLTLVGTIGYTYYSSARTGQTINVAAPIRWNTFVMSAAVFTWFQYKVEKGRFYKYILEAATLSFGIYAMHSELIIRFSYKGFHSVMCNPIIAIPIVSLAVFIICFIVSYMLKKIPYVGKWLV